jgi:LCP family protein required for cell wall assembly
VASLIGLAGVAGYSGWMLNKIGGTGGIISVLDTIKNPRAKFPGKDRINVLLIGKDYSTVKSKDVAVNGMQYSGDSRADTIVMLSLDLESRKVSALSIPRDSWVTAPDGKSGKINGTYVRGKEKLLSETVAQILGVAPDYTIALKDTAIKVLVDEVGGVDVETLDAMKYDDNWGHLHIDLPKGKQHLSGEQAIGFVRFRHSAPGTHSEEEGDFRRMKRQQDMIKALTAQAKQPKNLVHADRLVRVGLSQIETSLEFEQLMALGALFRGVQPGDIKSRSLQGKDGRVGKTYAYLLDKTKTRYLSDWLLKGDESASNRLTVVSVKNGTRVAGAAKQVVSILRTEGGFEAELPKNAPDTRDENEASATRVIYNTASMEAHAQQIVKLLGGGQLVKDSAPDTTGVLDKSQQRPDITVVLGKDLAQTLVQRAAQR